MSTLLFKTRVAVLWVAVAVALSYALALYLVEPGALEEVLAGEIEGETLNDAVGFQLAMFVFIPLGMAAVTLLVRDRVNHYVNLVAGLITGLVWAFAVVSETSASGFTGHILMGATASILGFLIAGLSLVGLRQPAAPASGQSGPHERVTTTT